MDDFDHDVTIAQGAEAMGGEEGHLRQAGAHRA